jgi:hypothetical protein
MLTRMSCRLASWLATNSPSWSVPEGSNGGGFASRSLICASFSSLRPSPRSSISTAKPLPTRSPVIRTGVFGGENTVAFSASSASMWMTSATADPASAALVAEMTLILV